MCKDIDPMMVLSVTLSKALMLSLQFWKVKQIDKASTRRLYASRIDSRVTLISVIPKRLGVRVTEQ